MDRFACATVRLADAVLPIPPFTELTAPVVLVKLPTTELVTFTLTVQELPAAIVPPVRLMLPDPATAVNTPPLQLPEAPLGVATTTFVGKVSVKATPFSAAVFAA